MDNNKYNSQGIAVPQNLGSQSPPSNPGVVYQPANIPTNPGAFKVAQQTAKNIIFLAQDGGQVVVGSYNPSLPNFPGYPSVTILDNRGNIIAQFAAGYLGDGSVGNPDNVVPTVVLQGNPQALLINGLQNPDRDTPISLVVITDNSKQEDTALEVDVSNASDGIAVTGDATATGDLLFLSNLHLTSTHFVKYVGLLQPDGSTENNIWVSDLTTPNGNLTGTKGDFCLNGPNGQPFWCGGGTTWTAV